MTSIVLVSHSETLARAVKELADQQTQGKARIVAVGGTGDPDHPFGTDAMAILDAIQSVYDDDGVLVLMDLGSAVMSAEMAVEFMDPEQAVRVQLSAGPFVEGTMAAAVQASIGANLESVAREAMEAMGPKREALGAAEPVAAPMPAESAASAETVSATVTLVNPAGLHFGPAVQFVQMAAAHQADIQVRNRTTGAGPADAKRFNQVLALGAEKDHEIEITASGPDAGDAVAELAALAQSGFGEMEEAAGEEVTVRAERPELPAGGARVISGIPASPGVALGIAAPLAPGPASAPRTTVADPDAEWERFQEAVVRAQEELSETAERMARELGDAQSRIFQAHSLALADPDFQAAVEAGIRGQHLNAEAALDDAIEAQARRYEAMEAQRFRERAADLRDVGARVLRILSGGQEQETLLPDDAIILAADLMPSQTARLDRNKVAGFVTAEGGPTSHTAILARSMGLPAVVGAGEEVLDLPEGALLAIDGYSGRVILQPDEATRTAFQAQMAADAATRAEERAASQALARTRDGQRVEVAANLATAADAEAALTMGAEGVGLLRTEFLFQDRTEPPTEEEQTEIYSRVATIMAPRPVIIRTLDIGGDKPAPYLDLPEEANPFLGWRAIRISLAMPEFFKTQLRAILRAAETGNVHVMFPMIATVEEVARAQALLTEAARELTARGIPHADVIPTGIMVEIPSSSQIADLLAPMVDFFSIGTNDLTQYTFAADRTNARVAGIADPLHPAVLRQIDRVIQAAHEAGRWVGLCGELAGQPEAIPVLLGLGLDEFSMSAVSIPAAKAMLARLALPETQQLARKVLTLPDGKAVRAEVKRFLADSSVNSADLVR